MRAAGSASALTSATELDTYAQWAWLSGRIGEAIDLYLDLARVYKHFPHVHFKLGYLFLTLQDYTSAVRHFSLEIDQYLAVTETGDDSDRCSTNNDAVVDASESCAVSPPPTAKQHVGGTKRDALQEKTFLFCACVGRSEAYAALHDNAKAELDVLLVANRGGNTKAVLVAMGVLFSHFGMHRRAEERFDQCAVLDSNDPDYLVAHAELRLAQKRYVSAAAMFAHCRAVTNTAASALTYDRALVGEGTALLRQHKLQDATILLLQAMNNLRMSIRASASNGSSTGGSGAQDSVVVASLSERYALYHHATNLYGGLCLLKGDVAAALDTYIAVLSTLNKNGDAATCTAASVAATSERFHLPMLCVLPGTRTRDGDLVDSTKLSTKTLSDARRHLNELERRYGPDACLYFHRAMLHHALGEINGFVHDLALVESMDPSFVVSYIQRDAMGDFLDVETIVWLPLAFIVALHDSLERRDHVLPPSVLLRSAAAAAAAVATTTPWDRSASIKGRTNSSRRNSATATATPSTLPLVSERALWIYLEQRVRNGVLDEYAHVHQLDVYRRLLAPTTPRQQYLQSWSLVATTTPLLSPHEGAIFDERPASSMTTPSTDDQAASHPMHAHIQRVLSLFGRHPCVHMVAGMVELERCNASVAHIYFTEALRLVTKQLAAAAATSSAPVSTTAATQAPLPTTTLSVVPSHWQQRVLERVRFYCLVWRSMTSRLKIEIERAVEDLNLAAAIPLTRGNSDGSGDENAHSADGKNSRSSSKAKTKGKGADSDPLLLVQRTLIMLLNGHLKSALKLLRQLGRTLKRQRRVRRRQQRTSHCNGGSSNAATRTSDALDVVDMFRNAGLNSFSLLPLRLEIDNGRSRSLALAAASTSNSSVEEEEEDGDVPTATAREDEETASAMIRYALAKKATAAAAAAANGSASRSSSALQTETLDAFFDAALVKLATTGAIAQTTPLCHAIVSIDESYLPPTNFASLELLKCKDAEHVDEKLYACFVRLSKRAKWLARRLAWHFEAVIDANLAHAYLPSDVDTLAHRAQLLAQQRNCSAAIVDVSRCVELLAVAPHAPFDTPRVTDMAAGATFTNDAKRKQWLQLLLERARLEMALEHWEKALPDLSIVLAHVNTNSSSSTNKAALEARALDARSTALIQLNRLGHAIQDLQALVRLTQRSKRSSGSKDATTPATEPAVPSGPPNAVASDADSSDKRVRDDELLTHILIGNLYCQLALDQVHASAAVALSAAPRAQSTTQPLAYTSFFAKADDAYSDALCLAPDHFLVSYFRGRLLALAAQPQRAVERLSDCLKRHPMFLPALFLRGCLYAQQRLTVLALADLYRVRHRAPTYPRLHTSIGSCHLDAGRLRKAVEALTEALQHDANDIDARYIRGCALQELVALESAVSDFTRVLALDVTHARSLYQRAVCYVLVKRYSDARTELDAALTLQSDWRDAWHLLAYACFCEHRFDDAVRSYSRAIELRESTGTGAGSDRVSGSSSLAQRESQLFLDRALANVFAGHVHAALSDLDRALQRDRDNYIAYVAKAFVLLECSSGCADVEAADAETQALALLTYALPHYKHMRLVSPCDVLETERVKAARMQYHGRDNRSASTIAFGFGTGSFPSNGGGGGAGASGAGAASPRTPAQTSDATNRLVAPADVLFAARKRLRDEQEQRAQAHCQHVVAGLGGSNVERPIDSSTGNSSGSSAAARRSSELTPHTPSIANQTNLALQQRRVRLAKFQRAIKKLTCEYRVLKALERATIAKYKKNTQRTRVLADLLRSDASRVLWPRGTLTTNILVWAFNVLGRHHARQQRTDDALRAFALASHAHPFNAVTLFNRGTVYLHMGALSAAVSSFEDALELELDSTNNNSRSSSILTYNNMGVALFTLERREDAHDTFAAGLQHMEQQCSGGDAKQHAVLLYNVGVACQHLDRPDDAMAYYEQAIALDSSRTEFFTNRSALLHQQLKLSGALVDYNKALALGSAAISDVGNVHASSTAHVSSSLEARLNRAQLFITMGNCSGAISDLRIALQTLDAARTQCNRMHTGSSNTSSSGMASSELRAQLAAVVATDKALAVELMTFCDKWQHALRFGVKDFLFALTSIPVFAPFKLHALFGQELSHPRSSSSTTETEASDADVASLLCPLPITDPSFFHYERDLQHWIQAAASAAQDNDDASGNELELDVEKDAYDPDAAMRTAKRQIFSAAQPFHAFVVAAMQQCEQRDWDAAARSLLRAHYKTTLDSPDEYVLTIWRVQVLMKAAEQLEEEDDNGQNPSAVTALDARLLHALTLLQDFLSERQRPDEALADDDDDTGDRSQQVHSNALRDADDDDIDSALVAQERQRRVIRADAYTLLGTLYQLNGQTREARRAFACALRMRDDHVIALLNYVQLAIVAAEYETALDCIVRLVAIAFARSTSTNGGSSSVDGSNNIGHSPRTSVVALPTPTSARSSQPPPRGLLHTNRAVDVMLPGAAALRTDAEWTACGEALLTLLRAYKQLLVSAHIETNTPHIFRKQGALAHQIDAIRQLQARKVTAAAALTTTAATATMLDLDEFTRVLDEYTASILHSTTTRGGSTAGSLSFDASSNQDDLQSILFAELAQVCDQVTQSLPLDARRQSLDSSMRSTPLNDDSSGDTMDVDAMPANHRSNLRVPSTSVKSPCVVAPGLHRANVATSRRPAAALLSARSSHRPATARTSSHASATGSTTLKAATPPNASLQSAHVLQPQRPQSGPQRMQQQQPATVRTKNAVSSSDVSRS